MIADINGDEKPDILFANGGGYYVKGTAQPSVVYLNKGDGTFADVTDSLFGMASSRLRQVAVADIDGDGDMDIYMPGGYGLDADKLFVQEPKGTFTDQAAKLLPMGLMSKAGAAHFGDLDNDGDMDLVVADWGDTPNTSKAPSIVHMYLNDGKGLFTQVPDEMLPTPPAGTVGNTPIDIDLQDVDGDYDLDIVLNNRNGLSRLFLNDGKGTFVDLPMAIPKKAGPYSYNMEACDIDGDGDLDLLVDNAAFNTGHSTQVLINDGKGMFADESLRIMGESKSDDNAVKCVDVDNDGDFDLVVASLSGGAEKLLINDGTGHFVSVSDGFPKIVDPTLGIDTADLDGDGIVDVVTGQGESTPRLNRSYHGSGLSQADTRAPVLRLMEAPMTFKSGESIPIHVAVSDSHTSEVGQHVREVAIVYEINGKSAAAPARFVGGDLFRAVIPPLAGGTVVTYKSTATDFGGRVATSNPVTVSVTGNGGTGGASGSGGTSAGGSAGVGAAGAGVGGAGGAGGAAGGGVAGATAMGAGGANASGGGTQAAQEASGGGCSVSVSRAAGAGFFAVVALFVASALRRRRRP